MPLDPSNIVTELALDQPFVGDVDLEWTDVSDRVRSNPGITISRGRDNLQTDFEAGTLSLTLDSNDRAFDPDYEPGPYYGLLTPDSQIRVRYNDGGTYYGLFRGFTGAFRTRFDHKSLDLVCPLMAWDAIKLFKVSEISTVLPEETTGDRIWRLLDLIGWPAERDSAPWHRIAVGSMGLSVCRAMVVPGQSVLELMLQAIRTEGPQARLFVNRDGDVVFTDRHAIWLDPILSEVQGTFGSGDPERLPMLEIEMPDVESEMYNQVEVSVISAESRLPSVAVATADLVPAGSTLFVVAPGLKSAIPDGAVLDFGAAKLVTLTEPGPASTAPLQQLDVAATYLDINQGAQALYDPNKAIRGDNASQARHGKKPLRRSNLLFSFDEAELMAEDLLQTFLAVRSRFGSITVSGLSRDWAVCQQILDRGFSDRILVAHDPLGDVEPIEHESVIEGIEHRIVDGNWETTWKFSEAPADRGFWVWDDDDPEAAVAGVTTELWF